jgi:magnesium transporter
MLRAMCHTRSGPEWVPVEDLSQLSELKRRSGNVLWVEADVGSLTEDDVQCLSSEFDLHPLAVEDAIKPRQRPKLEEYEGHLFTVLHQLDEIDGQLEALQIACFIGARYVITLHAGAERTLRAAEKRWAGAAEDLARGVAFLVHTLVDTLVDDYQRTADDLERTIEDLEEAVLAEPNAPVERQLYGVKQHLSRVRRYALPAMRILDEVVETKRYALIPPETSAYFRDVHDHLMRIGEQIRNVQELADAVVDLNRSAQERALNDVTKKLTGWAAIIAVPTFIASVWGMNFPLTDRPGEATELGAGVVLMAIVATALYAYFKRRDWL